MRKSENGPHGRATKNVLVTGMNTRMGEIINFRDHDQELAKNSPTSMETIQRNILIHITSAKISINHNLKMDVTLKQ